MQNDRVNQVNVEILAEFLRSSDFPALRVAYPELTGDALIHVKLYRDSDAAIRWEEAA